ncbi:MAG: FAD:protein FMN transferase [Oscillospiraceae bacterium]|nr:FAD:protein FMN transferase [Oscillospiraceae bacterium]
MGRRFSQWILVLGALALAAGCLVHTAVNRQDRVSEKELFAMDTVMRLTAYGSRSREAVEAAAAEIQRLDALLSVSSASGETARLNSTGGGPVSEDTGRLLTAALELYRETGGLFDCTVYPLMELWGFPTKAYHVPTEQELAAALPLADMSRVQFDGQTLTMAEGQRIDFGGIAKGYAAQRAMEIFQSCGVKSGMVYLGGNIQVLGTKPDGTDWRIGIQDPEGESGAVMAVLPVRDKAVVTSGGYERYFVEDGKTYIHILDPRTGCPAESDLLSVTVIAEDGTLADALSTSLFIMGREGAAEYWRESGGAFDMVLVVKDQPLYVTEGVSVSLETETDVKVITADGS